MSDLLKDLKGKKLDSTDQQKYDAIASETERCGELNPKHARTLEEIAAKYPTAPKKNVIAPKEK